MADTANDTYPFTAEMPANRLIWLANSKLTGDALHAQFKATHAAVREQQQLDPAYLVKQRDWHLRMASECDASGAKFTASEHRVWAEECRVKLAAMAPVQARAA